MAVLCVAVEVSIIHWPLTHIPWWRWLHLCNNVGVGRRGEEGKEGVHLNEKKGEKEERRFVRLAKQDIVTHAAVAEGKRGKGGGRRLCWRRGRRGEEEGRGGSIAEGGRFIIMIMALVTGLLAAAGLLCLLPACLAREEGD